MKRLAEAIAPEEANVPGNYVGEGYSIPIDADRETVDLFAKQEGL